MTGKLPWFIVWVCVSALVGRASERPKAPSLGTNATILSVKGKVEISRRVGVWDPAAVGQVLEPGDGIRAGKNSEADLLWSTGFVGRIGPESWGNVPPAEGKIVIEIIRGLFYFFCRDRPGQLELHNGRAMAASHGTEFYVEAPDEATMVLSVIDGEVEMRTDSTSAVATNGMALTLQASGVVESGPIADVNDLIQWCLYYPAVLDPAELDLSADQEAALEAPLREYRRGNLKAASEKYPRDRSPTSASERVFRAAIVLAAGQVREAESLLDSVQDPVAEGGREARLGSAIRQLISAVKLKPRAKGLPADGGTASERLAESYQLQADANLEEALPAARMAVRISPGFGFGWSRVAELEFCFGHVRAARSALDQALLIVPEHAQAVALGGFLLAASNRPREALEAFTRAIALDSAYADAWLGRGLCRIRMGDIRPGQQDLLVAASLEPQRSLPRSYLAKGFQVVGDLALAEKELGLAVGLDHGDPTPWLYRALLAQEDNRVNEAVRDLEESIQLNDNRALYRSRLLLDQDRAVRGANLATLYQDAGMGEVGVREAIRATYADWGNFSAHQFLANSLNALRDPGQVSLRYETAWLTEYLTAQLLAPVGAGSLSPLVSQHEYSRMFERDHLGLASEATFSSNGDWLQSAVQYGTIGSSSYALETTYRSENGYRPNNDLDQLTTTLRAKQQITPQDSVYLQAIYYNAEAGDLAQHYYQTNANTGVRIKETQEPILLAGYHREWSPGNHTLFLVGRLQDELHVTNPRLESPYLRAESGRINFLDKVPYDQQYQSEQEIYTAELQQILRTETRRHTLVVGGRYQAGEFHTVSAQHTDFGVYESPADQDVTSDFERVTGYAYYHWRPIEPLLLIGGVSYDHLNYPVNHRYAPVTGAQDTAELVGPKAGVIWAPFDSTTFRGGYARSLGGVSIDQSFRLEPSQVAGFNQAFRSVVPESVAGSIPAAEYEVIGASLEQRLSTHTYLGISAGQIRSDVVRGLGAVLHDTTQGAVSSALTMQSLDFEERSLTVTLNQLLGDHWSLGARYDVGHANLRTALRLPPMPADPAIMDQLHQDLESTLHQVRLSAVFNHPSGFFARGESIWCSQSNPGYNNPQDRRPGDEFWQFNLLAGYRFLRRHAELSVGLFNITDQDYRLNPLNLTLELPRERTLALSFRFFF